MSEYMCSRCINNQQRHVHELIGSVEITARCDPHNHRFATISCEAVPFANGDHVHLVKFRTDFYEDHFHEFSGYSGGAIEVGDGRHVHFASAETNISDGHSHPFRVAALINDPIGD